MKISRAMMLATALVAFISCDSPPPSRLRFVRSTEKVGVYQNADSLKSNLERLASKYPQIFYLHDDNLDGKVDAISAKSGDAIYLVPNHQVPKKAAYQVHFNPSKISLRLTTEVIAQDSKLMKSASVLFSDLKEFYYQHALVYPSSGEKRDFLDDDRRYPLPLALSSGIQYPLAVPIDVGAYLNQLLLYDDNGDGIVDAIGYGMPNENYNLGVKEGPATFVRQGYPVPEKAKYTVKKQFTRAMPSELEQAASSLLKSYPEFKKSITQQNQTHPGMKILSN